MTGRPHPARVVACTALLILSAVSASYAAAYQAGTGWLNTVFLWATVALLAWILLEDDSPGGLP